MKEQIKNICKKHPQIQKHVINVIYKKDKNFELRELETLIELFNSHKQLLKNKNFNIFGHEKIESAYDEITDIVLDAKAKNFLKSQLSNKTKHLVDSDTLDIIKKLINKDFNLELIEGEVFRKILKYKTPKQINDKINDVVKKELESSTIYKLKEKIEKTNSKILKFDEKNSIIVALINDYKASNTLGSKSWCISTSNNFWKSYVESRNVISRGYSEPTKAFLKKVKSHINSGQNYQFFVWDMNKSFPKDMVGLTYNNALKKTASHWRDDSYSRASIFDYISKAELNLDVEPLKGEFLLNKIKETGVKRYMQNENLANIIIDLDISLLNDLIKNKKVVKNDKVNTIISRKINSKSILDKDVLEYALNNIKIPKTLPHLYQQHVNKDSLDTYSLQYLLDNVDMMKNHGALEYTNEDDLKYHVKKEYLKSLSTIPLENPTIRGVVSEYIAKTDLTNPRNLSGIIAKTLSRGIKNKQKDWLENNIIKGNISIKIITYSYFNELLFSVGKDKDKNKKENNFSDFYDLILENKINFKLDKMSTIEKEKLLKISVRVLEDSISWQSLKILEKSNVSSMMERNIQKKSFFALSLLNEGILDDWLKTATKSKMDNFNKFINIISENYKNKIVNKNIAEKIEEIQLRKDVLKWTDIILNNKDYEDSSWKRVESNPKLIGLIKTEFSKKFKHKELLLKCLSEDNFLPKRKSNIKNI